MQQAYPWPRRQQQLLLEAAAPQNDPALLHVG
jgi:hypothetical protein